MGIPKHFYLQQSLIVDNISSLDENVIFKCVHCSVFRPNPPQVKKLITNYVKKERKKKYKQCVRQMLTKWGTAK